MKKFFELLTKYPISIVPAIIIVVCAFYVWTGLTELVDRNCDDVSMLEIEMFCESGPDFKEAAEEHIKMLKTYTNHMEDKYLARTLRVFCYEYSPTKGFERAMKTLEKAKDSSQQESAKAIWLAGEQVEQYRMKAAAFPNLKLVLHKYQKVPDELVVGIKTALGDYKNSSERFRKNQSMGNAVLSYEANRKTVLLLFLARTSYNRREVTYLFTRFRAVVEACRKSKIDVAKRIQEEDDPRKEFLVEIISKSEQRRLGILDAMRDNDMYTARDLMWQAIDFFKERQKTRFLSKKVALASNRSTRLTPKDMY